MVKVFYTISMVCMFLFSNAQSAFEDRIREIKNDIQIITEQEKEALRLDVEQINEQLEKKIITASEADIKKRDAAEKCAERIETRVEPLEREIHDLVQGEVESYPEIPAPPAPPAEGDLDMPPSPPDAPDAPDDKDEYRKLKGDIKDLAKEWTPGKKDKKKRSESRTTTQFVFAFGLNNLITDGDLGSIDGNGIKLSNSRFYEWGWTWKTRLAKDSPLLQLKYGMSLTYNNLRPDENKYFVKSGDRTYLAPHPYTLTDEPYFRKINLVVPIHLEFDFSKKRMHDDQVYVRSQKSFRLGIGGYAGISTKTKQILEYKNNGLRTEEETSGDYNTSQFVYGVSGYIGYKDFSIYTKFDLNPLFTDDLANQKNVSLGIRFDFN